MPLYDLKLIKYFWIVAAFYSHLPTLQGQISKTDFGLINAIFQREKIALFFLLQYS